MNERVRRAVDGIGWYVGAAMLLFVFALLSFLLLIQSRSDRLQWTGARVYGVEKQGLVSYVYQGNAETLDVPGYKSNPHYAVLVNKNDPTDAEAYSLGTLIDDGVFTVGPLVLGAGLVSAGMLRRRRERSRSTASDGFGQGLDADFVQRKLNEIRGSSPPAS